MAKFSVDEVYEIMTHIPKGKVVTFGEIATLMGQPQKSGHVGCAMKHAFEHGLPVHRVVLAGGKLIPGWEKEQSELLKAEGVIIKNNSKVDMKQSAWRPLETINID